MRRHNWPMRGARIRPGVAINSVSGSILEPIPGSNSGLGTFEFCR
jgi:hypothetical protein